MTKYNQLFKQQVIDFYLSHHQNLSLTLRQFGLKSRTVRHWIAQFNYSGSNGLAVLHTKRRYSPEFKLSVVQAVLSSEFTLLEASLHFGISNESVIFQWLKAFEKQGITGLLPKPKGRPSMKPKYAKMPPKPTNRLEELELENLRLRAEVAFLKKLDEIIKRDEAKQRKLSRDYAKASR